MKKRLFLGILALAAVAVSCSKDVVVNEIPQEQPIEFGTYLGRDAQTKAGIMNLDGLKANNVGFGVYAYYTVEDTYNSDNASGTVLNFMNDTHVTWEDVVDPNEDYWTYSPSKYWPNTDGHKLTFFAYAPAGNNNNNIITKPENPATDNTKGDPKITFSVNATVSQQTDLLFAQNNNTNVTKATNGGNVDFIFKHALSRIGFKAKTNIISDETTSVSINSIKINGKFYKSGKLNLNGGTWDIAEAETYNSLNVNSSDLNETSVPHGGTSKDLNEDSEGSDPDKGYIMIIPQNFDGTTDDKAFTITVNYTVTTTDNSIGNSVITHEVTTVQKACNFLQGKAYTFNLTIGLNAITFDAEVEDWITDINGNNTADDDINVAI